jgi:hypothetical protein
VQLHAGQLKTSCTLLKSCAPVVAVLRPLWRCYRRVAAHVCCTAGQASIQHCCRKPGRADCKGAWATGSSGGRKQPAELLWVEVVAGCRRHL